MCILYLLGIYDTMRSINKKSFIVGSGITIRYRRPLEYREKYKLVTKLVNYDDKCVYIEQEFISEKDNFISAVSYVKGAFQNVKPIDVLKTHFDLNESDIKFDCPQDLKSWIDYNQYSSIHLRQTSK